MAQSRFTPQEETLFTKIALFFDHLVSGRIAPDSKGSLEGQVYSFIADDDEDDFPTPENITDEVSEQVVDLINTICQK